MRFDVEFVIDHREACAGGQRLDGFKVSLSLGESDLWEAGHVHELSGPVDHLRHGAPAMIALSEEDQELIHPVLGFEYG
jgi:hypothetical protein